MKKGKNWEFEHVQATRKKHLPWLLCRSELIPTSDSAGKFSCRLNIEGEAEKLLICRERGIIYARRRTRSPYFLLFRSGICLGRKKNRNSGARVDVRFENARRSRGTELTWPVNVYARERVNRTEDLVGRNERVREG